METNDARLPFPRHDGGITVFSRLHPGAEGDRSCSHERENRSVEGKLLTGGVTVVYTDTSSDNKGPMALKTLHVKTCIKRIWSDPVCAEGKFIPIANGVTCTHLLGSSLMDHGCYCAVTMLWLCCYCGLTVLYMVPLLCCYWAITAPLFTHNKNTFCKKCIKIKKNIMLIFKISVGE